MTLYRLTGEQHGKFICTSSACLAVWHPLTASGGAVSSGGVASLGTVMRPGGIEQVTFKGEPLYTFAHDAKPGDAKGQGINDVGKWTAVQAEGRAGSAPSPSTNKPPASSGGAGRGSGY